MAYSDPEKQKASKNGKKGGRPAIKYDKQQAAVVKFYAYQRQTRKWIADKMNMGVDTLRKLYKEELENGAADLMNAMVQTDIEVALDKDHKDAAKCRHYHMERRGGFVKTERHEHSGGLKIISVEKGSTEDGL